MCPDFSCCGLAGRLVVVSDLEIENRWWWCKFLGEFVLYAVVTNFRNCKNYIAGIRTQLLNCLIS